MQLQYRITSLIALNYLIALIAANEVDATFFLFMIQPLLIWGIGKMLNSAVPRALRLAARDNYIRLDGTKSESRRTTEHQKSRMLQLQLFYLVGTVSLFTNLFVLLVANFFDYLPPAAQKISPLFLLIYICIAFEFMRRCYLNLIRDYGEQIAERHMLYLQRDMDAANDEEEQRESNLKPVIVPSSSPQPIQ